MFTGCKSSGTSTGHQAITVGRRRSNMEPDGLGVSPDRVHAESGAGRFTLLLLTLWFCGVRGVWMIQLCHCRGTNRTRWSFHGLFTGQNKEPRSGWWKKPVQPQQPGSTSYSWSHVAEGQHPVPGGL